MKMRIFLRSIFFYVAYTGIALVGFWFYLVVASAMGWIMPVWWGGEELLFPILITPFIAVSALLIALILFGSVNITSYASVFMVRIVSLAFAQGAIFSPCISFVGTLVQLFGIGSIVTPQISVIVGLIVSIVLNFIIVYVVGRNWCVKH
jgi:hypothetical protein